MNDPKISALQDALEHMVYQFAYRGHHDGRRCFTTGGLSALEEAFDTLGWNDPDFDHADQLGCQAPGCQEWATCGTPTPEGYKHCCGKHFDCYQGNSTASHH